jgi:hypothetical protein
VPCGPLAPAENPAVAPKGKIKRKGLQKSPPKLQNVPMATSKINPQPKADNMRRLDHKDDEPRLAQALAFARHIAQRNAFTITIPLVNPNVNLSKIVPAKIKKIVSTRTKKGSYASH